MNRHQNPLTLSYESQFRFAESIFLPLKKAECVSCMFVAGGGKRTLLKHLLSDEKILKNIFGKDYRKTLFVYVDSDEILEVSNKDYLELILISLEKEIDRKEIITISRKETSALSEIKNRLSELIDLGWRVIFILNDFELTLSLSTSIYLNLESILAVDKSKISYLFLSTINLLSEDILSKLHNLKYAVSRKVRYFPLFNKSETDYLIDIITEKLKTNISEKVRKIIHELCGGHPQLLKYSLYTLRDDGGKDLKDEKVKALLLQHYQLKIVCADIWNFLSQKEKDILIKVVTSGNLSSENPEESEFLLRLELIKSVGDKQYGVFSTLFEEFIKNKLPVNKLVYDKETKELMFGNKNCEDKFTFQEFKLLSYFMIHQNELITRDQVAEVLWGTFYHDKYSDYSIDKTISTLRKKLDALGFHSHFLVTLKKRGFSFSNP